MKIFILMRRLLSYVSETRLKNERENKVYLNLIIFLVVMKTIIWL